ncbi:hypothetical protein Q5692_06375 [Microcoleus sp. C2C3]|uniref:hypothetical protein n=1 Tax=unclassified Microcoleus TaxID=2642155 RepID=UPI002FD10E5C
MKEERRRKNEEGRQRMDVTDVRGVTDLTDRRKKEEGRRMSLKIFFPKQKAPLFLGALFVNQRLKLSR